MASSSIHLINPAVVPVNSGSRYFSDHPLLLQLEKCSDVRQLKTIHAKMLRAGLFSDPYSASKLIQVAALSGVSSLGYAQKVFDEIPHPNLYSWNALIRSHSSSEEPVEAIMMFVRMLYEGVELPNKFTFPFVIKASGLLSALRFGKGVHGMVVKSESADDLFILNSLVHFYSACACLDMAYQVFLSMPRRDIVSWNSMIVGFAQAGYVEEALDLFHAMEREDQRPNDVTMVGVLSACGKKQDLDFGRSLHSYISTHGFNKNLILNNAILDMYVKCGSIEDAKRLFDEMEEKDKFSWTTMIVGFTKINDFDSARRVFHEMPEQDTAAWNALISAYEKSGNPKEALSVFNELQMSDEVKPDAVTLVCALSACAQMGLIDSGGWIHVYIKKHRMKLTCHLATSLIDMYSKCGDLEKAVEVFESLKTRDVFVWSAMIGGFAMHGKGKEAKELFLKMQEANVSPNSVTFTNLLTAFSHSGLVDDGKTFFAQMEPVFGVVPELKHYACLVDILGRAGKLKEAVFVIENMPISPGASVWGALLAACGLHSHGDSDLAIAERACTMLLELEPENDGAYVLLSNIYAKSGRWDQVSSLRKLMRNSGVRKEPGCSSIEIDGIAHEFLVGDCSHPQSDQIYSKLDEVAEKLKSIGFVPKKSQILQFVEEEDMQEQALISHSEKLAMAFGLIHTSANQPIRIIKNLRVCSDCHAVAKLISKLYDREILLRDRVRFHRFKGGSCSCMDYW